MFVDTTMINHSLLISSCLLFSFIVSLICLSFMFFFVAFLPVGQVLLRQEPSMTALSRFFSSFFSFSCSVFFVFYFFPRLGWSSVC